VISTFHHRDFPLEMLLERKRESVTVVLPTREVADTIVPILTRLQELGGLVDQLLVVDAASGDGTAELAAQQGAEVHQESDLVPEVGPVLGKGDAMWRALSVARGEIVIYLDSDTSEFSAHFATGMLGPLLCADGVEFLKGFFRRPYTTADGNRLPMDGGRVTELTARPLLSAFYPELAVFAQPLAGEVAARRGFFERIPFASGYSIETSMLLHARDLVGVEGMAQVDLEQRINRHQTLAALAPMSYAVLRVVLERLRAEGRLLDEPAPPLQTADGQLVQVELVERPPFASLRAPARP
jgi:glucosyl-3-phosphoglycerate synthase